MSIYSGHSAVGGPCSESALRAEQVVAVGPQVGLGALDWALRDVWELVDLSRRCEFDVRCAHRTRMVLGLVGGNPSQS